MPVRVYDIAKKLGIESKEVIAKAKVLGIPAVRVPSSAMDKVTAEYLEEQLGFRGSLVIEGESTQAPTSTHASKNASGIQESQRTAQREKGAVNQDAIIRRLVMPLRNREEDLFEVSPLFLGDDARVQQISDEDYATLHREENEIFVPIVSAHSQCLIVNLQSLDGDQAAYEAAAKAQFVFKTFSSVPLILSHAAVVTTRTGQKSAVEKTLALPVWGDYGQFLASPFSFSGSVSAKKVSSFFQVVTAAVKKQPGLLITISRFNSCWLRSTDHDRVIDVAVSLESLLSSVTEIKFKFALFNAFITSMDPASREKTFNLLQVLYDARSSIVHGDTKSAGNKKKIDKALECFTEILDIAQAAITYYIFFLNIREPNEWANHLEKLVFGTENRLNQGVTVNEAES
jgi:hypothetical protein